MPSGSFGVAGSSPLSLPSKTDQVLLRDAVQAAWPSVTSDPPASSINFLNTWFTDSSDIELIFRHNTENRPSTQRSTDWRYRAVFSYVDVHVFVRGAGGDEEPDTLLKTENALKTIIDTSATTLIPNCRVSIDRTFPSSRLGENDMANVNETVWHSVYSIELYYWVVNTS